MCIRDSIGSDQLTDVGLIQIDKTGLTPINIGDSTGIFVGDLAVAIGHPLTLGAAPTAVSYTHLTLPTKRIV